MDFDSVLFTVVRTTFNTRIYCGETRVAIKVTGTGRLQKSVEISHGNINLRRLQSGIEM